MRGVGAGLFLLFRVALREYNSSTIETCCTYRVVAPHHARSECFTAPAPSIGAHCKGPLLRYTLFVFHFSRFEVLTLMGDSVIECEGRMAAVAPQPDVEYAGSN